MASWKDKAPTFNPYIAQQPVEAMVKVGMYKQQKYEEGYKKIQDSIDKVAGLDIVRDLDKQYLQGKLNTLSDELKTVAAGDFSNFQLTNSVAGMASKIIDDTNVQNAVSSTINYKNGMKEMDAANKEGKGNPANTHDFQTSAQKWLSGDLETGFSSKYQPYVPVKQNALKIIKELTGNSNITEDIFTKDKNGNMVISDSILRTELAGVSPERIQKALRAGLSQSDFNQLQIDGRYKYSSAKHEDIVGSIQSYGQSSIDFYTDKIQELEQAKLTTNSVPQQSSIQDNIDILKKQLEESQKAYVGIAEMVEQNPEGAKGML